MLFDVLTNDSSLITEVLLVSVYKFLLFHDNP
jgi:hypothetical protein